MLVNEKDGGGSVQLGSRRHFFLYLHGTASVEQHFPFLSDLLSSHFGVIPPPVGLECTWHDLMSYLWLLCVIKIMIKCLMWMYTYIFWNNLSRFRKKRKKKHFANKSKMSSWILFIFCTDTQTHKHTYSQCSLEHSAPPPGLLCVLDLGLWANLPLNSVVTTWCGEKMVWRNYVHFLKSNKPRTKNKNISKSIACVFRQVWVMERPGLSRVSVLAK